MFNTKQTAFDDLRNIAAEHTDRLIAWIGSGLSRPAGLPSWIELRRVLHEELECKASFLGKAEGNLDISAKLAAIESQQDMWIAFDMLRNSLGKTTYQSIIRRQLEPATTCTIPYVYQLLWKLPMAGLINLNLDGLATRSFHNVYTSRYVNEFTGRNAGDHAHVLKSPHPFILNLHGFHADASSWVLTNTERAKLQHNKGCCSFIDACLMDRTVVFAGVTADDRAVKRYLESLTKRKVDFGTHYWLTSRTDPGADLWAEKAGVRIINYSSEDNHSELLRALELILEFVPNEDEPAAPVAMTACSEMQPPLPSPGELQRMDPGDARIILNGHACNILSAKSPAAYAAFNKFCEDYGLAIHGAWYTKPPHNRFFGYELGKRIGGGAFSSVFGARDEEGGLFAVKVLREELRDSPSMFQSFRRGVQSMRILAEHNLSGIVPYQDASEIPASVIMERIDGPNLHEAVESGELDDWWKVIRFAFDLSSVVRAAHLLPERVLHRDIRPSNIMLRGFFTQDDWEVLVLDFDLSWHLGASELSVLEYPTLSGYLAPEQLERMTHASTRNALVDSFGFGMTLYFARTGISPLSLEHRHSNWEEKVAKNIAACGCGAWNSLSNRYARMIINCTRDEQSERWDMTQAWLELSRLSDALADPRTVRSAELWAEELAARACSRLTQEEYGWNSDTLTAGLALQRGVTIELMGDESRHSVVLSVDWMVKEGQTPSGIVKYLPGKCQRAEDALRKHGWNIRQAKQRSLYSASFVAHKLVAALIADGDRAVDGICAAANELRFGPHEA
ncbi:protein kinase [Candidatus Bipolaricaulota bacterium]|nr:protein kinase [Candidatus Bipolaricaulota bacterium]